MRLSPVLVIAGTFLPVIGAVVTAVLALILSGPARWVALVVVPALTGVVCWNIAQPVMYNGNLLAAVIYILYLLALMAYYPGLLIVALVIRLRRRAVPAS